MRLAGLCLAAAITCIANPATVQDRLATLTGFGGRCHSLTLFDRDVSRRCEDLFATLSFVDGRAGFLFLLDDRSLVTFTAPRIDVPDPHGRLTLAIDQVHFVFRGEGERMSASGFCHAGDPTRFDAPIACDVTTVKGRIAVNARSYGGPGTHLNHMPRDRLADPIPD